MSENSLIQGNGNNNPAILTRKQWLERVQRFVDVRLGLVEATDREFLAGYVDGFKAVYAKAEQVTGEPWYVWFIFPGDGKAARIVNEVMPGVFCDHEGNVYEHDPAWTIVLVTVTRIGKTPLLSSEMLRYGYWPDEPSDAAALRSRPTDRRHQ